MPPCLKSYALTIAREVAGLPPDEEVADRESAELHRLALVAKHLPTVTRQVFTLRKVYECSPDDIASRLRLSPSQVEAHLIAAARACTKGLFGRTQEEPSRDLVH